MFTRLTLVTAVVAVMATANQTHAAPIYFDIASCASGDCPAFAQSGGGSINVQMDVVDDTNLLITLTNRLNADAVNDDPYLTNLGFEYTGLLSGLAFESFTVIQGNVVAPTLTVDSSIRSFFIDFGFAFPYLGRATERDGRFQAMDPNEIVQIALRTTSVIDASQFTEGVAKVAGAGTDGLSNAIVLTGAPSQTASVPEPGTLGALIVGLATFSLRRRRAGQN
jgi:hypothetical protein